MSTYGPPKGNDTERFWSKIERRGPNDCWPWLGTFNKRTGYGCIRVGSMKDGTRRQVDAHRYMCEITYGLPKGSQALHHCDNRACVNPLHLYVGSHADNMRDMQVRGRANGRGLAGQGNGNAKLTEAQVRRIKKSPQSLSVLSKKYGVSKTQISWIKNGKSWAHVG